MITALTSPSSIISALATFHCTGRVDELKEKLTFYILSGTGDDNCDSIARNYEQNNKKYGQ
jgi:hypothetical protein